MIFHLFILIYQIRSMYIPFSIYISIISTQIKNVSIFETEISIYVIVFRSIVSLKYLVLLSCCLFCVRLGYNSFRSFWFFATTTRTAMATVTAMAAAARATTAAAWTTTRTTRLSTRAVYSLVSKISLLADFSFVLFAVASNWLIVFGAKFK